MSKPGAHQELAQFNQQVIDLITAEGEPKLVILFGSLASRSETSESDLDLAVLYEQKITTGMKKRLIEQLAQLSGRPVDLIDLKMAGEPLLGKIVTSGKRLFGSDSEFGRLLSKHLIEQADFMPYRKRILDERRARWIGS